jgi:hypothetical protein
MPLAILEFHLLIQSYPTTAAAEMNRPDPIQLWNMRPADLSPYYHPPAPICGSQRLESLRVRSEILEGGHVVLLQRKVALPSCRIRARSRVEQ